jgi:hypothetical protein
MSCGHPLHRRDSLNSKANVNKPSKCWPSVPKSSSLNISQVVTSVPSRILHALCMHVASHRGTCSRMNIRFSRRSLALKIIARNVLRDSYPKPFAYVALRCGRVAVAGEFLSPLLTCLPKFSMLLQSRRHRLFLCRNIGIHLMAYTCTSTPACLTVLMKLGETP